MTVRPRMACTARRLPAPADCRADHPGHRPAERSGRTVDV